MSGFEPGAHLETRGDAPAVIMGTSGEVVTYRQLDKRSSQGAHLFRSLGLKRGDHIAFLMENTLAFMEICWAAQRSGLYYTAISRYLTADEIAYIVKDCGAKILITTPKCADAVVPLMAGAPGTVFFMTGTAQEGFRSWDTETAKQPKTPIADESALIRWMAGCTGYIRDQVSGV